MKVVVRSANERSFAEQTTTFPRHRRYNHNLLAKAAFFVSFAERKTAILAPAEERFGEMWR